MTAQLLTEVIAVVTLNSNSISPVPARSLSGCFSTSIRRMGTTFTGRFQTKKERAVMGELCPIIWKWHRLVTLFESHDFDAAHVWVTWKDRDSVVQKMCEQSLSLLVTHFASGVPMIDLTIKMRNYGPRSQCAFFNAESSASLVRCTARRGGFKPLQQCLTICGEI